MATQPIVPLRGASPAALPRLATALFQAAATGLMALLALTILAGASAGVYRAAYEGRLFPGVSVAGLNLSGLTADDAARQLAAGLTYPYAGRIVFRDGDRTWIATPAELGLEFNIYATMTAAYSVGRVHHPVIDAFMQLYTRFAGRASPLVVQYDVARAQAYLQGIASQIDQPVQEASVELVGTEVVAHEGQIGRQLDLATNLALVAVPLGGMTDVEIPLVVQQIVPEVLDPTEQAGLARVMLSQPFTVNVPEMTSGDPGPFLFQPEQLARMLAFRKVNTGTEAAFSLAMQDDKLAAFLAPLVGKFEHKPENPRYLFDDASGQVVLYRSAVRGRSLNVEASASTIQAAIARGEHAASLVFEYTNALAGDNESAAGLGITGLLPSGLQYTSFRGSTDARIHNITLAAEKFNGVLVAPGEIFSMAEHLGDVSFDTGYAEALIIVGNSTIKGAGGGVCQVSTTLYRTVFMTGFPIVERHPHAYRVGYYENGDGPVHLGAGFDATVFVPQVDFRFQNDSPYWILMETDVDRASGRISWRFYSTSDGRTVDWTRNVTNRVDPPQPRWVENADLAPDEWKQVDWAVEGADAYVTRTVTRGGQIINSENINTHYVAWAAMCQFSPSTPVGDGSPCPP
ncbi:MAG TPA: VanW family protein [Anaerolineales bacterium]|nr:VanW family protein [Anaerolineales bacterium]